MTRRLASGVLIIALLLAFCILPASALRGGRGGGGRGGGGARMGGGNVGGGARMGGGYAGGGYAGGRPGGGGFTQSPAVSGFRPAQQPGFGGGAGGRPTTLPAGPGLGGRPGVGQGGAGGGRPSTLPAGPGLGNRPGVGQGGVGAGRPSTLPAGPGFGNRPGVGNVGNVNIGNVGNVNIGNVGRATQLPAYNNWHGAYGNYHAGWVNGYWHGYHANDNWGWGRFAVGAAAGVAAWALGSAYWNWGCGSYANPYYYAEAVAQPIVIEQVSAEGVPQTFSVPAMAYDYSQPLDTESAPPPTEMADPAVAKFDAAREAFRSRDYARALQLTDEALKVLPNDATLHEFRALVFFATGKYDLAAGPVYAVLSVGPGWDWTTLASLYPTVNVYTDQLRKLEAFVGANPASAAGRFVLGYHYMTEGFNDAAAEQFKQIVAISPSDTLSAQLLKQLSPPGSTSGPEATPAAQPPAAPAVKPGVLTGSWNAQPAQDTTIDLRIGDDKTFTWTVTAKGKPRPITGTWSLADDVLTLAQAGQGSTMVGRVAWQAENRWSFRVIGTAPQDPGLVFSR